MKNLVCISVILLVFAGNLCSQIKIQTVKGRVFDKDSKMPLPGANIVILNTDPPKGAASDVQGYFKIENVEVGKKTLKISFLGYEDLVLPEITVSSGKETMLNIELQENVITTNEITITAEKIKNQTINSMATVSGRVFSVEETNRFAGGFNDPSRMAIAFAGVSAANNDEKNDIVIRGNSPRGLLWRLEGIEIPNPNHFSDGEGDSGGLMSMISSNVLANSDFYTGAFSAEYGNALSGVFDINIRKGNYDKREYYFQGGVLGLEAGLEGPFSKNSRSSYLVKYRYTNFKPLMEMGLVDLGKNRRPTFFQDFVMNLNFETKKAGNFGFFAIGGMSTAGIAAPKDSLEWTLPNDRWDELETHRMGVAGLKHFYLLPNKKTYIKSIITATEITDTWDKGYLEEDYNKWTEFYSKFSYPAIRASFQVNHKYNVNHTVRAGVIYNQLLYDAFARNYNYGWQTFDTLINQKAETGLIQAYAQWKYRISEALQLNSGLHSMYFLLNNKYSIEPRVGVKWQFKENQSLGLAFGVHSRVEALSAYLSNVRYNDIMLTNPNKNVDFTRALHTVLGYDVSFSKDLRLKTEIYYQFLYNVPVDTTSNSNFSALNAGFGIPDLIFNNNGKGYNYGLELTLEKFYSDNYYMLVTISLFDSKYKPSDGKWYNTMYNSNYLFNVLAGKEFKINHNSTLGVNLRGIFKGGYRNIPINLEKSIEENRTIYNFQDSYKNRLPDFSRFDIGLNFKKNCTGWSWGISIDIQNITNKKNVYWQEYDNNLKAIKNIYSQGLVPILNFKVEF